MVKVSIVLPVHNGEKYLSKALDSIIAQTYSDWELIIVNDFSTDQSLDIAKQYQKMDERIRIICNEENLKLPKSLNAGFAQAKGQYLTWTSDDNLYAPDAIARMASYLETHPEYAMVCANMFQINAEGVVSQTVTKYQPEHMFEYNTVGACFMYRKEARDSIGDYAADMFLVEDYDYWLRIQEQFGANGHIDQELYYYRYHNNSLTEQRKTQIKEQLLRLRMKHADYIQMFYQDNHTVLCQMYYESGQVLFKDQIHSLVPELAYEVPYIKGKKCVVYGAGQMGLSALELLGNDVANFADGSASKVGQSISGVTVLSLIEMKQRSKECQIVIAAGPGKVYDMIKYLIEHGIKEYCVLLTLINEQ